MKILTQTMTIQEALNNIAKSQGIDAFDSLLNQSTNEQKIDFISQAMEVYANNKLYDTDGEYVWVNCKDQLPVFNGNYILNSNVGIHNAWFDTDSKQWSKLPDVDKEFVFEFIKWTMWPKA